MAGYVKKLAAFRKTKASLSHTRLLEYSGKLLLSCHSQGELATVGLRDSGCFLVCLGDISNAIFVCVIDTSHLMGTRDISIYAIDP
jgi:hypothetical protein